MPQDWLKFNGRRVLSIHFPRVDDSTCPYVQTDEYRTLICHAEYLGDRTEVWIADIRNGAESARYNARMAETIVWDIEAVGHDQ